MQCTYSLSVGRTGAWWKMAVVRKDLGAHACLIYDFQIGVMKRHHGQLLFSGLKSGISDRAMRRPRIDVTSLVIVSGPCCRISHRGRIVSREA